METTKAVKETKGELVYYGEQLADTYYYSTSCGYGTNTGIWLNSVPENFPYLQAKAVNVAGVTDAQGDAIDESVNEADISPAGSMMTEEEFAAFITTTRDSDFEKDEAWYRWTYQVDQLDSTILYSNIVKRYEANPGAIYGPPGGRRALPTRLRWIRAGLRIFTSLPEMPAVWRRSWLSKERTER